MLRILDQLANHGLNDTYVSIEKATEGASEESDPKVWCQTNDEEGKYSTHASHQQDRLTTYAVAQTPPIHAGACFGE
jgi:hypothetical protein